MTKPKFRCAIYTRKSSEEGLEQDFNSLDAQREACEAYIASQSGEGWTLINTRFDDGGYSGGNMERPGLTKLLNAIKTGRVDVVVVYKVDRLTRALSDFARIIETFDENKVSFVSVTQAFNTTTSMGRLTLNVLLSFAQFEREVTGERIRDKLAASKKKGLWMGGNPPLGYDADGRTLKINKMEAEIVRLIFKRYTELKSVDALVNELAERGITSKLWISKRGKKRGGYPLLSGAVRHLLQNPIYLGKIRHKDQLYPGQHKAIIPQELWDRTQKTFEENSYTRKTERIDAREEWWLTGKLFDALGRPMTPTFTSRSNGQRYKYYFVQDAGADVDQPDDVVTRIKMEFIHNLVEAAARQQDDKAMGECERIGEFVQKVVIERSNVRIVIEYPASNDTEATQDAIEAKEAPKHFRIDVPVRIARVGQRSRIIPPTELGLATADPKMIRALRQAWQWRQEIENGTYATPELLAEDKGVSKRYVNKMLPIAFVPPSTFRAVEYDLLEIGSLSSK